MEADISIWRKPGHFYFALTQNGIQAANWPTFYRCENAYKLLTIPASFRLASLILHGLPFAMGAVCSFPKSIC